MMDQKIIGKDIVIVGQQPWDVSIGSNCKDIAIELSKHNRVLYVNSALDRISSLKGRGDEKVKMRQRIISGKEEGLIPLKENLWTFYPDVLIESVNWINNAAIFDFFNKRNNRIFSKSIKKAMRTLDFKEVLLFNDNDMFKSFYLQEFLTPELSIYYSRDYMLAVDYWKKHGERIEPELIRKSSLCVANSTYLADYCRRYNPASFYIGQGCDLEIFTAVGITTVPEVMALNGPKIGYVGALQSIRLDIELIAQLAERRPEWQIILVGPEDEIFRASRLHQIPNIHFLGSKPPAALPNYIQSFDVCINPQLVNQVTIGNYPRKIDEYLAMGKPVVATLTQAVGIFEDCAYLAASADEFVKMIELGMEEDTEEKREYRKKIAFSHSWENSVNELYKAIHQVKNISA